jgi:hypothetical protein
VDKRQAMTIGAIGMGMADWLAVRAALAFVASHVQGIPPGARDKLAYITAQVSKLLITSGFMTEDEIVSIMMIETGAATEAQKADILAKLKEDFDKFA